MCACSIHGIIDDVRWQRRTSFRWIVSNTCRSRHSKPAYRQLARFANFPTFETLDAIRQRGEFSAVHPMDGLPAQVQPGTIGLPKNEIGLSLMMRAPGVICR